jgi:uncharacterized protein (DUF1697 family)
MPSRDVRVAALLRGVNVGGNKKVPMADLRRLLEALGYRDVATLLNSGNAVFTASAKALPTVADDVEEAIHAALGVRCSVVVRTGPELDAALAADPWGPLATDASRSLIGFLGGAPAPTAAAALAALDVAPDQVKLIGREVYLWVPDGVSSGLLSKASWEKLLGVPVTSRNVNTVAKLAAMAAETA